MSQFINNLNPPQQQAVIETDGPILILAGAGSGKTRVLTYKVAYLILKKNVPPDHILMVTFTNKAANEMKERISKLLKTNDQLASSAGGRPTTSLPFAGTFHSICAKLLRREYPKVGRSSSFVIYDTQDSKEAIKQAMQKLNIDPKKINPSAVASMISQAKNELITADEYPKYAHGRFQEDVSAIYANYQRILSENNALDFDDLLLEVINLFRTSEDILRYYQEKFRYLLVDEYQDTNFAQYTFTKLISQKYRNICIVGDASQSIYAWRGADYRNILKFRQDYPKAKVFNLEQNYRSTQTILHAAYAVISKNTSHPILKLWTEKGDGEPLTLYQASSEHDEAAFIVKESSRMSLSDTAILYRTNAQSRVIEEVLLHHGVPYVLVGGQRFYERKEIKDVISYLRMILNPHDSVSLKRIEKLGKRRFMQFETFLSANASERGKKPTMQILDDVLHATGYLSMYNKEIEEDRSRLENIKELRSVASEFPKLDLFLENIALVEQEYSPVEKSKWQEGLPDYKKPFHKKDAITLMTMHAAKGLEFKSVFMVGMEEGLFPHARTLFEPFELEEERRLCYVGITRAMERLYLTFTRQRLYFGQRNANAVSRFISDLPEHLVSYSKVEDIPF